MDKSREELLTELRALRERVAELETVGRQRESAEKLLREKEEDWRLFSLATSNMLWHWSFEDDSVERNIAFETAFGYTHEEVAPAIGWWVDRLHDGDRDRVLSVFRQALESGRESCRYEYRFRRADGSYADILDNVFIIRDETGKGVRALGAMTDITDRKRIEEEQIRIARLQSLGTLAGGIAHDFNNLLTGIMGNLSLLEWRLPEGSEELEIAGEARLAAERTQALVSRLLTFAKGGAPQKGPASLDELLRRVTSLSLSGSNSTAEFQIPEDLPMVDIDTVQVEQVIQNLVLNADQAMPGGGLVSISARQLDLPEGHPPSLKPGRYVEVCIADEGTGMSADLTLKIFDPYFSTKKRGHGLGLATAYSILSRHGGDISVSSQPGVGSKFAFRLPVTGARVGAKLQQEEGPMPGAGRILLVDDQEVVRTTACRILRETGYEVKSAHTAAAALESYKASMDAERPFDLVIMDLTAPGGMGGKEAVSAVLKLDPQARVVVTSGYAADPVVARYKDYGFVGRLQKPFSVAQLTREVRKALSRSR